MGEIFEIMIATAVLFWIMKTAWFAMVCLGGAIMILAAVKFFLIR
jgi:F0F1-type ATP synthase assembly protein I